MEIRDIKNLTLEELKGDMLKIGESQFHARQIFQWIYVKNIFDFDRMTDLSKEMRTKLASKYSLRLDKSVNMVSAPDKTEKYLFRLMDGSAVESVLIPSRNRSTLCISSQVGCKFGCKFCASGSNGFVRNLEPSEIVNQVLYLKAVKKRKITNYVFMGMGEPLDNYENVLKSLLIMKEPCGLNVGARSITLSTCGIVPGIKKLMQSGLKINLSVSLHAATDELRSSIVPVNRKYPIRELCSVCADYFRKTGRIVTLEYVLLKDVNDSLKDAGALALISKRINAKVNLILYNPVRRMSFVRPSQKKAEEFTSRLKNGGAKVTLRESRGQDITAACGQLYLMDMQ